MSAQVIRTFKQKHKQEQRELRDLKERLQGKAPDHRWDYKNDRQRAGPGT